MRGHSDSAFVVLAGGCRGSEGKAKIFEELKEVFMTFPASQPVIISDSVAEREVVRWMRVRANIAVPPSIITTPVTERGSPRTSKPPYDAST
jgi:uncharacterized membrane protein